jgi:hypothetical protein
VAVVAALAFDSCLFAFESSVTVCDRSTLENMRSLGKILAVVKALRGVV